MKGRRRLIAENALDHESDAAFRSRITVWMVCFRGRHVPSYLIVRMSHNEAEQFLHVCTNQKPNTCLKSEASIIIRRLQDHLADRSWYDERHAASHVYYLELEYHAALPISARVSSCELSVMAVRCQAREMGCLVCTASWRSHATFNNISQHKESG